MTEMHALGTIPQSFCWPPTHVPPMHTSLTVQNWPSSQEVPSVTGTTTQVFNAPSTCPVLHTAIVHCGVWTLEQSSPQGPWSDPPAPPPLLLLLLLTLVVWLGATPG